LTGFLRLFQRKQPQWSFYCFEALRELYRAT